MPEPGTVELVLTPEDLGRMRFEVTQSGEQMRIHLTVERPETLDLLRRHADQLLAEFREAGYADATLSFGQWSRGGQHSAAAAPLSDTPLPQPPTTPHAAPDAPRPTGGGLDLRL